MLLAGMFISIMLFSISCSGSDDKNEPSTQLSESNLEISSTSFSDKRPRKRIDLKNSCHGENISPPLSWSGAPDGVATYALLAENIDHKTGKWVHWVVYDIPVSSTGFLEGISTSTPVLTDGTTQGTNDKKQIGYYGPCPPPLLSSLQACWGTKGTSEGQLNGPSGLVFDRDENIYVVDHRNHRIQKFTKEGRFLGGWGSYGQGEGEFNLPWGITLDHHGDVYVADWRNDRIQKFTPDGEFLGSYGKTGDGKGEFNRPSSVAVDKDGDIYVADWGNNRVQVIAANGSFVKTFIGDATASDLMRKDAVNGTLQPAMARARFMADDPQSEERFFGPVSVKLDDMGRLYVVDSYRFRIQVYQKEGYPSPVLFEDDLGSVERILTL